MNQYNIYNYIGQQYDPLYQILQNLKIGETVSFDGCFVSLNEFGLYEVKHREYEFAFSNLEQCYVELLEITDKK